MVIPPRPPWHYRTWSIALLAALSFGAAACGKAQNLAMAQASSGGDEEVELDVPYVPTPHDTVHRMLELANPGPDDFLVDLGSGDGRIVIGAVRDWGVPRAVGVDIDPERIAEARENARAAGVEEKVSFEQGDLFEKDFSEATVLTMYLLETINLQLRPIILDKLKPGTRVVSHVFTMGEWEPDETVRVRSLNAYLWIVPAKVGGKWLIRTPDGDQLTMGFFQTFQEVEGSAIVEGNTVPMNFARLRGDEIRFAAAGRQYIGKVEGDRMTGVAGPGAVENWHAERL